MKKIINKCLLCASIILLAANAEAAIVNINIDSTGLLQDSVFGFQVNYNYDIAGAIGDLDIHYNKKYDGSGVVDVVGNAVPGTDMSALGMAPSTDWDITGVNGLILGYTMGDDPLGNGRIISFDVQGDFNPINWELSDASGTPDTFIFGTNVFANFDPSSNTYTISSTASAVPIPGAVWLLGSGLVGLVVTRRKKKNS